MGTHHKYSYQAFGLQVVSDIPFPGSTLLLDETVDVADVIVSLDDLSSQREESSEQEQDYVFHEDYVLFRISNVATYIVSGGNKVTISPCEGVSVTKLRLYLDGYAMGFILLQRRILPLHGSAVVMDGRAYAIIGRSGAGKSTLTKALLDQGHSFLSDDVIPISLHHGDDVMVYPALPEQKLWQDSLEQLGMDEQKYDPIYERRRKPEQQQVAVADRTKFAIPVSQFHQTPVPLAGIFELVKSNETDHFGLHPLHKMEQLRAVTHHTFHRSVIASLDLLEWHFRTTTALVNRVETIQLRRSTTSQFSAVELAAVIGSEIERIALRGYSRTG